MRLVSLILKNFRNYKEAFVSFSPGINLIIGENGSGKTALLEALYVFVTGRSFRTHRLSDLIAFGESSFSLQLTFVKDGVEQTLTLIADATKRKIFHNDTPLSQLSSLFGLIRAVLLTPKDAEIITGQPASRRHFLDLHCAQVNSEYLHHLSRYMRAMKQRNALLRNQNTKTLDIWEEEMALSAFYLSQERQKVIQQLENHAQKFQAQLSDDRDQLHLSYFSQAKERKDFDQFYREKYKSLLSKELDFGYTVSGPHKDDIHVLLGQKEARVFGSIGQIRSTAISLRFAELLRFKAITNEFPLFFLDDLAMGLDRNREQSLYNNIALCDQSILTSPHAEVLPKELAANIILIKSGQINV